MAESKCPKCDSTKFDLARSTSEGAISQVTLVQCASCGCVVGALEATKIAALLQDQHVTLLKLLGQMDQRLIAMQFKT